MGGSYPLLIPLGIVGLPGSFQARQISCNGAISQPDHHVKNTPFSLSICKVTHTHTSLLRRGWGWQRITTVDFLGSMDWDHGGKSQLGLQLEAVLHGTEMPSQEEPDTG